MSYYPTIKRTRIEIGQRCTETGCNGCGNHDEPIVSPSDMTVYNNNTPSSKNANSNATTTTSPPNPTSLSTTTPSNTKKRANTVSPEENNTKAKVQTELGFGQWPCSYCTAINNNPEHLACTVCSLPRKTTDTDRTTPCRRSDHTIRLASQSVAAAALTGNNPYARTTSVNGTKTSSNPNNSKGKLKRSREEEASSKEDDDESTYSNKDETDIDSSGGFYTNFSYYEDSAGTFERINNGIIPSEIDARHSGKPPLAPCALGNKALIDLLLMEVVPSSVAHSPSKQPHNQSECDPGNKEKLQAFSASPYIELPKVRPCIQEGCTRMAETHPVSLVMIMMILLVQGRVCIITI